MTRTSRTVGAAALVGVVAAVVVLAVTPGRSSAHSRLVSSTPEDGSLWSSPPSTAQLAFSSHLDPALARVSVTAPDGTATTVRATVQDRQVSLPLPASSTAGGYVLRYRVRTADGHPLAGQVSFEVETASGSGKAAVAVFSPPSAAGQRSSPAGMWPMLAAVALALLGGGGLLVARRRGDV